VTAHLRQVSQQVAVFETGLWWYYAGDYARAMRAFEQFLTFFPSREVYHNLAVSHHQLALQAYQAWQPDTPALPMQLSLALDPLTRANQVFLSRHASAERGAGRGARPVEVFRQHIHEAITLYREALAHDDAYMPAASNLGCALLVSGVQAEGGLRHADVYEAVATLQRALERAPHTPELLNNLGVALLYVERLPHARTHLTQARSLAPTYAAPVFNLAYIAQRENRLAEAQQYRRDYEQLLPRVSAVPSPSAPDGEHIMGVGIGDLDDQVPQSWGKTAQTAFRLESTPMTVHTYATQVQTLSRDGEILLLVVRDEFRGTSARGIAMQSAAADVLARYGAPTRRLETTQGQSWSYDTQRIAFQLRDGRVVSWVVF
jgi:tetratricopeptide (TPR) repeat protein